MTADIELLPLPKWLLEAFTDPTIEMLCDYTRANVAHATAPLQAEIEALRVELDRLRGEHVRVRRDRNAAEARAERLAEAINAYKSECDNPAKDYVLRAKRRDEMFALLRDHDQEGKDG